MFHSQKNLHAVTSKCCNQYFPYPIKKYFLFPLNCKNRNPSLVCVWHEHKKSYQKQNWSASHVSSSSKERKTKNKKIDFLVNFIEKEKSFIYNNNNYLEVCEERIPFWTIWFLRLFFTLLNNFWLAILCVANLKYFNDNPQQEN